MTKKVIYLSPYFWPEEIGSAHYCTELAVWLQQHDYDVNVLAFRPHYPNVKQFGSWSTGARDNDIFENVKIARVPVRDRGDGGFKTRVKNDIGFLWRVLSQAVAGNFKGADVVVAYVPTILTLFGASIIGLLTGARVVGVIHDIESGLASSVGLVTNRGLLKLMEWVEKVGLNRADHLVVLTEGMRRQLTRIGCTRPVSVLPIWATPTSEMPVPTKGAPILMYSGNFGKKQDLDQLLPLMRRLSKERDQFQIIMQGDGSEKSRIEKMFRAANITNTQFLPLVPAERLSSVLQSANIHLVPQAVNVGNYALPSKLISIMSAGRPFVCIAERDSSLDELCNLSAAGVCVQPGDNEALFQTIVMLANDPEDQRQKGENGRRFVDQHMKKETIMRAYEAIISDRH